MSIFPHLVAPKGPHQPSVSAAGQAVSETSQFLTELSSKIADQSEADSSNQVEKTDKASGTSELTPLFNKEFFSVRDDLEALRGSVSGRLRDLFNKNGIDTSSDINLQVDELGQIRVQGNHPDKNFIETLLAGEPDLSNDFRKLSSLESLMKAAREAEKFQKAYAENPQKAIQDYSHLFNKNQEERVTVRINQTAFDVTIA